MRRLAKSFQGLNSSLAQSSAETFLHKNMCKLLDFCLNPPEVKVLIALALTAQLRKLWGQNWST